MSEKTEQFLEKILKHKINRRPYSPWPEDIKKEAIEILKNPNCEAKKISKLTGIDLNTFKRWKKEFSNDSKENLSSSKNPSPNFKEVKILASLENKDKPQRRELNKLSFCVSVCDVDIRFESHNKENLFKLVEEILYVI